MCEHVILIVVLPLLIIFYQYLFAKQESLKYSTQAAPAFVGVGDTALVAGRMKSASPSYSEVIPSVMLRPDFQESQSLYDKSMERKLVKRGSLSLIVENMDKAKSEIERITKSFGGFVQDARFSEKGYLNSLQNYSAKTKKGSKSGYFEVKIPTEKFSEAFSAYKATALKVEGESVSVNDVTERYLDLETQIKNKKAEEEQYRQILKKAYKVEDVLKVTQYINKTRMEIERMQGRLNFLKNQVLLSSIRINLISEKDMEFYGVVWSPWYEIKSAFHGFLQDGVNFLNRSIAFVFKLPFIIIDILLWLLLFFVLWKVFLKIKNKLWDKKKKESG